MYIININIINHKEILLFAIYLLFVSSAHYSLCLELVVGYNNFIVVVYNVLNRARDVYFIVAISSSLYMIVCVSLRYCENS